MFRFFLGTATFLQLRNNGYIAVTLFLRQEVLETFLVTFLSHLPPYSQLVIDPVYQTFAGNLGPVQTSNFSCASSNVNEQNPFLN